jgi:hypothetical protein
MEKARSRLADLPVPSFRWTDAAKMFGVNLLRRILGAHIPRQMSGQVPPADWKIRAQVAMPEPSHWKASQRQTEVMLAQLHRVEGIAALVLKSMDGYRRMLSSTAFTVGALPYGGCFGRTLPTHWSADAATCPSPADAADRTLAIRQYLFDRDIQTLFYVPQWWWDAPAQGAGCPNCDALWPRTLYVPNHPLMSESDIREVCTRLAEAWNATETRDRPERYKLSRNTARSRLKLVA